MATVRTLLVPIDFSPSSESGAHLAARIAENLDAEAILLHALPPRRRLNEDVGGGYEGGESPNEADAYWAERLAEVAKRAGFGSSSEQLIVEGEPAPAICQSASGRAELIVLATRGFGAYRADLLGSNTAKVLHDCSVPVLTTVHRGEPASQASRIEKIVCSVDLNAPSLDSLRWAYGLTQDLGATLYALYVAPEFPIEEQAQSDFRATLMAASRRRMSEVLAQAGVEAEPVIETGELASTVAAVVRRLPADLLALGRRPAGKNRITAHIFEILRSSPCPVVSV